MVNSELAKGIRKDSILLGISFGDTRQFFFERCHELNGQQLVSEGPNGTSVQYLFKDSVVHLKPTQIRLLFSPFFDSQENIAEMDLEFSYPAWAPWNTNLHSDTLKVKVMELMMHWYGGNEFVTAKVKGKEMPVKVDGNRRIYIKVKDHQAVSVRVQDLLHEKFKNSISK